MLSVYDEVAVLYAAVMCLSAVYLQQTELS